jgi:hypothetical protein
MAGKTLEEYFVSLGIKGQNVALKNIKDVKKQATDLTKNKAVLNFGKGIAGKTGSTAPTPEQKNEQTPEQKNEEERKNNKKFSENINKFVRGAGVVAGAMKTFATSAASLDPVATMQGMTNAMSKVAGGWEILGFSAGKTVEGLGELMNAGVGMASGAVNSAKQSAAATYGITQRDVTTAYYGGMGIKQTDKDGNYIMSRQEHSDLAMTIAGSYGKIQKPMVELLNTLVETKDTAALGRVASGNWASTGTDKGWFLQQIANETQGLPPSIAQAIQKSLLENNKDLIQNKKEGNYTEEGQRANAMWRNSDEDLQKNLYAVSVASEDTLKNLINLNKSFNNITANLVSSGSSLAAVVNTMASAVNGAIAKINSSSIQK